MPLTYKKPSLMCTEERKCLVCGDTRWVHLHHIYFGAKRPISDREGFTCYLCQWHHEGTSGVHGKLGRELDLQLKRQCQAKYEETHSREEFISLIKVNYLG